MTDLRNELKIVHFWVRTDFFCMRFYLSKNVEKVSLELEWGVAFTILLYDLSSTHNILTLRDLKKKGKRGSV